MSYYSINPVHPHLGAAINLRLFPLAAAQEVGFADVAEAYLFYGDGFWERGHKLIKREGNFHYKIPQYNGARLILRFYLVDSEGKGAFTYGAEHPIAYGQYAELFAENHCSPAEVGGAVSLIEPAEIRQLPEQIGQFLRHGAESFWIKLDYRVLETADLASELGQALDSVRVTRLPGAFLEVVCPQEVNEARLVELFAEADLIGKKWFKAIVVTAEKPDTSLELAQSLGRSLAGKQALAGVTPQDYLSSEVAASPLTIPIYRQSSLFDLSLLRGVTAETKGLLWTVDTETEVNLVEARFQQEYALATGIGHYFSGTFQPRTKTLPAVFPVFPDLAVICPQEWLSAKQLLPGDFTLEDLVITLEKQGYLTSLVACGQSWQARGAVFLAYQVKSETAGEKISNGRHPVLVFPDQNWQEAEETVLPSGWSLEKWPQSLVEFVQIIGEWYSGIVESMSSWVVIPGKVQKRRRG